MNTKYLFTSVAALGLVGLLTGCGSANGATRPVTSPASSIKTTTAANDLQAATNSSTPAIQPTLFHAGEPTEIVDMKTGAYLSVSNNGTFVLTVPNGSSRIYGKVQRKDTATGYVLTSVPGTVEFSVGSKLQQQNGTLTATFVKKNGKWHGSGSFKSSAYSVDFEDNTELPNFMSVAKQVRSDFLTKNYHDLYKRLDPSVAAQVSYKQFVAAMSSGVSIQSIEFVGSPISQGQFPLITASQQTRLTYTQNGKKQTKLDTWVFSLTNGQWMYEGSE